VARYSYYALSVLTGVNFLNYIDRQILPAVAYAMKQDPRVHLSDTEIGAMEAALLLSFTVLAPVFGRLGAAALAAVSGRLAASAVSPDTADARYYGFCGHTYTTHHCPGPYFPPRIDLHGRTQSEAHGALLRFLQ
jgi:hypothetical protein